MYRHYTKSKFCHLSIGSNLLDNRMWGCFI